MFKKKAGGKTLVSEISVVSTIRGYMAPPQALSENMTKMKILKKIHARKKKAGGQKFSVRNFGRIDD